MGDTTTTQTTNSAPWGPQQKYLKRGMQDAFRLYKSHQPGYYPGQTVAGFSPEQGQAFDMMKGFNGSDMNQAAEGYATDLLKGKYLDPNNDAVWSNVQSKVMPAINSQFAASGRYGSGMQGDTLGRALTEAYAPTAAAQYQQGLDRMSSAAQWAPTMKWQNIQNTYNMGQQRQNLQQQQMDDAKTRYDYYKDLPYNKLGQFLSFIQGNYGGRTTSAQNSGGSMWGKLLGGGLGLLGAFL